MDWIKCSERMPDYNETVLVWARSSISSPHEVHFARLSSTGMWLPWNLGGIEWWMPLPEPPKGEA